MNDYIIQPLLLIHANESTLSFSQERRETETAVATTRKEEFAAVTVPYGLMKAGLSLAICSSDEGRIPLSLVTVSFPTKTQTVLTLNNYRQVQLVQRNML